MTFQGYIHFDCTTKAEACLLTLSIYGTYTSQ